MKIASVDQPSKSDSKRFFTPVARFWKTIAWTLVILILSFLPGTAFQHVKLLDISFQDLIVHFLMYAVLTILVVLETSRRNKNYRTGTPWWLIPLLMTATLGSVTEIVQALWIRGRDGNIVDFILNVSGSVMMLLLLRLVRPKSRAAGDQPI